MTNIYYQGEPWSYHYQVSLAVQKNLNIKVDEMIWFNNFEKCWDKLWDDSILVLAIENSSAGTIYENLYKFDKFDAKIIWEYNLSIDHCLCSMENDISKIKKVYSHFKALPQCYEYLKRKEIKQQEIFSDTAWAAKMLFEKKEAWSAAICSSFAWKMYWLNILEESIQDQDWNTTRFLVIVPKKSSIEYLDKKNKISILFEARDIPASLYKCLWAFATNNVNLTKIESLPNIKDPFSYFFWLGVDWKLKDENVIKSLDELKFFTSKIKVIWEY